MRGKNFAVFDLEIKKTIDGQLIKWTDHHLMGVSVGVAFFYKTMAFKVYLDDNLDQMVADLNACDVVSGFNIDAFDIPLLRASVSTPVSQRIAFKTYDLLTESRKAFGVDKFAKGFKLDDHLLHTFGRDEMKIANGAEAPIMYQEGRMGELITYCLADVAKECLLFNRAYRGEEIKTGQGARVLRSPRPETETAG